MENGTVDRIILAVAVALMVWLAGVKSYQAGRKSMIADYAARSQDLGDCWQRWNNSEGGQE